MSVYKVLNKVKNTDGYDILNPMTPFDILTCSSVSFSSNIISVTTNMPSENFVSGMDFVISFIIPSSLSGATAISVNGSSYALETATANIIANMATGDVVLIYIDISSGQGIIFGKTANYSLTAGSANTANSATTATSASSVPASGVTGQLSVANGGTGANSASGAKTNLGFATSTSYTATLSTTWSGTGPYTQTVNITGILATDSPIIDIVLTGVTATDTARLEGWGLVGRAVASANSIAFTCYDSAPTVSLPIKILCVR